MADDAEARAGLFGNPRRFAYVAKSYDLPAARGAHSLVVIQDPHGRIEFPRTTVADTPVRIPACDAVPVSRIRRVIRDKQVQPAIPVVVEKRGTRSPLTIGN